MAKRTAPPAGLSASTPDDILENAPVVSIPSPIIPDDDDGFDDEVFEDFSASGPPADEDEPTPFKPARDLAELAQAEPAAPKRDIVALRIESDFTIYFMGDPVKFRVGDDDITDPGIMQRAVAERKRVTPIYAEA